MTVLLLVISIVAATKLPALQANDDYRLLLKSDSQAFDQYQRYQSAFGSHEQEVLVIIQGDVLSPEALANLTAVNARLAALDEVAAVASLLDIPWVRRNYDDLLAGDAALHAELKNKLGNPAYLPVHLVSANWRTTVVSVSLRQHIVASTSALVPAMALLQNTVNDEIDAGLTAQFAGYPALRAAIKKQTLRDAVLFGVLSVLLSVLVARLVLHNWAVVAVSVLVPVSAVVCSLALMIVFSVHINILNQMLIALVLVITYSDVLHVIRHLITGIHSNQNINENIANTFAVVMPACLMTSFTTAAGFASLVFSSSAMIQQFGILCATGMLVGLLVVALSVPVMALVLYRNRQSVISQRLAIPQLPLRLDKPIIVGFALLTVGLLIVALQLKPDYRMGENLPAENPVRKALQIADTDLGGVVPYALMIQWPQTAETVNLRRKLGDIRKLQRALEQHTDRQWSSVIDLMRFSKGFNASSKMQMLPESVKSRVFNAEHSSALIVTQLPVMNARSLNAFTQQAQAIVDKTISSMNQVTVVPAGLLPLIDSVSRQITTDLLKSLAGSFAIVSLLILIMFRSVTLGALLVIPNIAPLAAIAAILVLSGGALKMSTVVVFSICLGIVVDDSIHFVARFQQLRRSGHTLNQATALAYNQVGSVLVQTSLVIGVGFSVLLFSNTPPVQTIGALALCAIPVALLFDLMMLPALMRRFAK